MPNWRKSGGWPPRLEPMLRQSRPSSPRTAPFGLEKTTNTTEIRRAARSPDAPIELEIEDWLAIVTGGNNLWSPRR